MKTRFFFVASLALLAVSCVKNEVNEVLGYSNIPEGTVFDAEFSAFGEGVNTKTALSSNAVMWTEGDAIAVYPSGGGSVAPALLTTSQSGATATFSGSVTAGDGSYYCAVYPYAASSTMESGTVKGITLSPNQTAVKGSFDSGAAVMMARSTTKEFEFKNVCGLIKVTLTKDNITAITLKSANGISLTGTFDLDYNSGAPVASNISNGTDWVTLSNGGSALEPGDYYFTILPGTMTGGFTLYWSNGANLNAEQVGTSDAAVLRSHVLAIGEPDSKAEFNHRTFEDFEFGGRTGWHAGGGAALQIVANPSASVINPSATCLKYTTASNAWDYVYSDAFKKISYSTTGYQVKMDCYAPAAGKKVYLKINNVEVQTCRTTVANAWETLVFNFRSLEAADVESSNITICADAGGTEVGAVYYFDNIRQTAESGVVVDPDQVRFLGGFEGCGIIRGYGLSGASWDVVANPSPAGINTSATCGVITKSAAAWDGMYTDNFSTTAIDFSKGAVIKMQVYSPKAGQTVQIKLESGSGDTYRNVYVNAATTKSNEWEDLVFDFGSCFQSNSTTKGALDVTSFRKFVICPYGGNTSASGTRIYVDNIRQCKGFADLNAKRVFGAFEKASLMNAHKMSCQTYDIVDNPSTTGINPSPTCARIVTAASQWNGIYTDTFDTFKFSRDGYKLKMHVYSPAVGLNLYMKIEVQSPYESCEVIVPTTVAGEWEDVTFDFTAKAPADSKFNKFSFMPDGNGTSVRTFYIDNLRQCK